MAEARAAYRAALDDELSSGWWLADTLSADAEACVAVGNWEDAGPRLLAAGEAAREKRHPLRSRRRRPTGSSWPPRPV